MADGAVPAFDTDVMSLSISGVVVPYYLDSIMIAAFGAAEVGAFVSASAGNGSPSGFSVTNVTPWVTTVGAGSIDRHFSADVKLENGKTRSRLVYDLTPYGYIDFLCLRTGRHGE